jgi:hypothetical protein
MELKDWVEDFMISDTFRYLDPLVRDNLKTNKSMRQGFVNLFEHFAKCLDRGGFQGVPVLENVTEQSQMCE